MREHEPARVDRGPVAAQRQRGDLRGAIASKRCYLDLSGANISASHAKRGGGVSFNNGRIVRTIVSGCSAEIGGGVLELMAEGPLSIEYSTISSNHASYTGGGVAIFFTGPSVIKRSTINNNFKGRFDMGWDAAREQILKNQVAKGIVPAGTKLAPRAADIPLWSKLPTDSRKMYARQMEAFAAMLTQTDDEIGRIVDALKWTGQYDNTLIFVTSDNGASGEGGLEGTHNEALFFNGFPKTPPEENMKRYEEWGTAETNNHYRAGWAMAGNTPFKYFKQTVHNGGMSDALIVTWPKGIAIRHLVSTFLHRRLRRIGQRFFSRA